VVGALVLVSFSIISLVFPALFLTITNDTVSDINPYEPGANAIPFFVVTPTFIAIGILYFKGRLPEKFQNAVDRGRNFEISKKVAMLVFVVIIITHIVISAEALARNEIDEWADWVRMEIVLKNYPFSEATSHLSHYHVTNSLLHTSVTVFQNERAVPYLASIALLVISYFFTTQITQKRFAGIVTMVVLVQSFTFQRYDAAASYPNFWILFYLTSLYLIHNKRRFLSPVFYVLSIFAKPLSAAYLPMSLFFIFNTDLSRKQKIKLSIPYIVIVGLIIGVILSGVNIAGSSSSVGNWNANEFLAGFATLAFQLRFDVFLLVMLVPVIVMLFIMSQKINPLGISLIVLIVGSIIVQPVLTGLTEFNIFPYRYMPFVVFLSIGIGFLFSKKITQPEELWSK
jgi:hypothetical protein